MVRQHLSPSMALWSLIPAAKSTRTDTLLHLSHHTIPEAISQPGLGTIYPLMPSGWNVMSLAQDFGSEIVGDHQ